MTTKARILIVEDQRLVAEDLAEHLATLGYDVVGIAATGEEAVAMAGTFLPQLIFMDIRLQSRMDGISAAEQIRDRYGLPVVYLTAHADDPTVERARRTEPYGYLHKPYTDAGLRTAVEMAVYKHQAEMKLRQSERRYATTLNSIGDAVIATDPQGRITFMNAVAESYTGWTLGEAVHQTLETIMPIVNETTRQVVENPVHQVLRTGTIVGLANHTILINRQGQELPIDDCAAPIQDDRGAITGVVVVFRDVAEKRRAENLLRQSEARTRAIFLSAFDGILTVEADRRLTEFNPAAEAMFGYSAAHAVALQLENLVTPSRESTVLRNGVDTFFRTGSLPILGQRLEMKARRRDDSYFPIEVTVTVGRTDPPPLLTVFVRDLTHTKQLEERLQQSEKMDAIGQLAGGVAHDFNNLLMVINGYSNLLVQSIPESNPWHAQVQQILRAGDQAAHLTRQLLAFSRKSIVVPRVVNLNQVVTDTMSMLTRVLDEMIEVRATLDPQPLAVVADPTQLESILLNLAVNARDAMPRGGTLTISTANVELDGQRDLELRELKPGSYRTLVVTDTGIGMAADVQKHIFEPFFTTKAVGKGTGMGLASVYGIVKQAAGHIQVKSAPGQGATFTIYFPAASAAATQSEPQTSRTDLPHGTETILLAEDDQFVRILVKQTLAKCGYRIIEAGDGQEAIDAAAQLDGPLDLLISDVVMPKLTGAALLEKLRRERPNLKVLFVTGYTDLTDLAPAEKNLQILVKPFPPHVLAQKVRKVLDE